MILNLKITKLRKKKRKNGITINKVHKYNKYLKKYSTKDPIVILVFFLGKITMEKK